MELEIVEDTGVTGYYYHTRWIEFQLESCACLKFKFNFYILLSIILENENTTSKTNEHFVPSSSKQWRGSLYKKRHCPSPFKVRQHNDSNPLPQTAERQLRILVYAMDLLCDVIVVSSKNPQFPNPRAPFHPNFVCSKKTHKIT
jgi:hypothetical protein